MRRSPPSMRIGIIILALPRCQGAFAFELTMSGLSTNSNNDVVAYLPTASTCDSWGSAMTTDSVGTSLSDLPPGASTPRSLSQAYEAPTPASFKVPVGSSEACELPAHGLLLLEGREVHTLRYDDCDCADWSLDGESVGAFCG